MGLSVKGNGWKRARASGHGMRRAAYWRALGFPNMARARARYAEMRAEKAAQLLNNSAETANGTVVAPVTPAVGPDRAVKKPRERL